MDNPALATIATVIALVMLGGGSFELIACATSRRDPPLTPHPITGAILAMAGVAILAWAVVSSAKATLYGLVITAGVAVLLASFTRRRHRQMS